MYIVTLQNGGSEITIHGEKEKLQSGNIVKGINAIDTFTFTMLPSNAGFDEINEFTTLVKVYNTNKNSYEFLGRVLYPESEMSEDGAIVKKVTCESLFGFFCDSVQTYVDIQNWTVSGLLKRLIDCHNSQVEEYKRFSVGNVTATDDNDNLYLGIQRENTWDAIKSNLIDKIGGELQFRVEDGVTYIDYLEQIGETKETEIALSVNMKSITREKDPTSYITRLVPVGAKLSDDTEQRVDITSVNGGLNYIDDEDGVAVYGIHAGVVEWDDVTKPNNLLAKARNWLKENNRVQIKYSISALDLSLLGLVMDDFELGNFHPIKNKLLGIDDTARIIKKNVDVCNEVNSTIEVGDNFKTLSDIQLEQKKVAAQSIATLKQTASGLQGQVNSTNTNLNALAEQVTAFNDSLTQQEVFNRLTNNGELEGLYMYENKLYINASYIEAGKIVSGGTSGGYFVIDLDKGEIESVANAADSYGVQLSALLNSGKLVFTDKKTGEVIQELASDKGFAQHMMQAGNVRIRKAISSSGTTPDRMGLYFEVLDDDGVVASTQLSITSGSRSDGAVITGLSPMEADDPGNRAVPKSYVDTVQGELKDRINMNATGLESVLVGKAPSGYGLGGGVLGYDASKLDSLVLPGWYKIDDLVTMGTVAVNGVNIRVDGDGDIDVIQTMHMRGIAPLEGSTLTRRKENGAWKPWEWENPPMMPDVEYRTTQRHNGKAVYTKYIDLGTLPNTTSKTIEHNLSSTIEIVGFEAYAKSSTSTVLQQIPLVSSSTGAITCKVHVTAASVYVYTFADLSDYTGYAVLRYTKQ